MGWIKTKEPSHATVPLMYKEEVIQFCQPGMGQGDGCYWKMFLWPEVQCSQNLDVTWQEMWQEREFIGKRNVTGSLLWTEPGKTGNRMWPKLLCDRNLDMTGSYLWPETWCDRKFSVTGTWIWPVVGRNRVIPYLQGYFLSPAWAVRCRSMHLHFLLRKLEINTNKKQHLKKRL
jgi:hypothetical protein